MRATISWQGKLPDVRDFRMKIVRAGATLVDEPMTIEQEHPAGLWPGYSQPLLVQDMDGDGEPEVVADLYTGGAHCCEVTKLWSYENGAYTALEHDWGNPAYRAGKTLFVGAHDWSYAFSAYAFSVDPVQVLDPRFSDVTTQHPRIVERDLRRVRHLYAQCHCRSALAAYVADLHALGRHDDANALLARAKAQGVLHKHGRYDVGPYDGAFVRRLDRMLREGGYISRNSDSTVSTT